MGNRVLVCGKDEVAPGRFRCVAVEGKRIVLYNVSGALYATSATCAHLGGPLDEGLFEGVVVTCPWHGWQFDVRTGEAIYDPGRSVATYPVSVVGDDVLVEV
jgi:nitrite reductase (NADH) small subunit/3-phenylpropionate/trans-cinnamate dioxygenase ferredoxin subunit